MEFIKRPLEVVQRCFDETLARGGPKEALSSDWGVPEAFVRFLDEHGPHRVCLLEDLLCRDYDPLFFDIRRFLTFMRTI